MFDIGFWELVILFGLGLMVLGPERMPKVAAKLGRWVGQARNMARHLSNQIRDEIEPFESGLDSVNKTLRKDFSAMRPEPGENSDKEAADTTTSDQSSGNQSSNEQSANEQSSNDKSPAENDGPAA